MNFFWIIMNLLQAWMLDKHFSWYLKHYYVKARSAKNRIVFFKSLGTVLSNVCTYLIWLWSDFILHQSFCMFKQPRKLRLVRPKSSSQVPTNPIEWRQKLRLPSHMSHKNFPSTSHGIGDEFWSVIGRRAFAFWHSL